MNKTYILTKIFFTLLINILLFNSAYSQLVNDFRVNDDTTTTSQYNGRVGVDANGNFAVVWLDFRISTGDIYCQLYYANGQKRGNNFLVSSYSGNCNNPDISMRKDGSFAVCWSDTVVKYRLFNSNGTPTSLENTIDNATNYAGNPPRITCDTSGNFVVVYQKYFAPLNNNIHFQRFDSNGNKIGISTRVNDDTLITCRHLNPAVTMRRDGSFIICWQDERPPSTLYGDDIYMQMYDKYGNKTGSNVRVNNNTLTLDYQYSPQITSDSSGRFYISFTEIPDNTGKASVLYQSYTSNGTPVGINSIVVSDSYDNYNRAIEAKNNGDVVVAFVKETLSSFFSYCQRISQNGTFLGNAYLVSNQYPSVIKNIYDLAIANNKIISIWADNRFGNTDVFCNIRSYTIPDSITSITPTITETPSSYSLSQNYPNPFNPVTKIKFNVAMRSPSKAYGDDKVVLKVYDVLGREVQILVDERLHTGTFEVIFNGENQGSGIYFYTLIVNNILIETKKMIIMK